MTNPDTARGPIAITMGEPAGIGGEILLKAWTKRAPFDLPAFFAVDDPERLEKLADTLGMNIPVTTIDAQNALGLVFAHLQHKPQYHFYRQTFPAQDNHLLTQR